MTPARTTVTNQSMALTRETVDAGCDSTFIRQVSGDAAFVFGRCSSNKGGVEDEAIFGGVTAGLQGSGKTISLSHGESQVQHCMLGLSKNPIILANMSEASVEPGVKPLS